MSRWNSSFHKEVEARMSAKARQRCPPARCAPEACTFAKARQGCKPGRCAHEMKILSKYFDPPVRTTPVCGRSACFTAVCQILRTQLAKAWSEAQLAQGRARRFHEQLLQADADKAEAQQQIRELKAQLLKARGIPYSDN